MASKLVILACFSTMTWILLASQMMFERLWRQIWWKFSDVTNKLSRSQAYIVSRRIWLEIGHIVHCWRDLCSTCHHDRYSVYGCILVDNNKGISWHSFKCFDKVNECDVIELNLFMAFLLHLAQFEDHIYCSTGFSETVF